MKVSRRDTIDRYYVVKWRGWAIFVHHIKKSDPRTVMHTHPWTFFSFILGSYTEETPWLPTELRRFWNFVRAGKPHRVTITKPVWTILIHGPKRCPWAVTNDFGDTLEEEPWSGTENQERTGYVSI